MRRLLVLSLVVGMTLLATAAGIAQASGSAAPIVASSAGVQSSGHPAAVTVRGPHMFIAGSLTNAHYAQASTVTVSQTNSMVYQMVQVSWTGFTHSNPSGNYDPTSTEYPVEVVECKGTHPTDPSQCYGATNNGSPAAFLAYGPGNAAYGTTGPDGKGQVDIQVYTTIQNQFLGCDAQHACSLVVVPSQGGDSWNYPTHPHCADHSADSTGALGLLLDTGQYAFRGLTGQPNGLCSWQQRIVIPLHFAPLPGGCPFRAADFTAVGSPMLARAITQWQTGLCTGSSPITVQYNSAVNESEARAFFLDGTHDVAFTTLPVTGTGKHPFTYAPVAVSAVSIAYWVDSTVTAQPFTNMRLNPRLVAKLLTTSYAYTGDGCPGAAGQPFGCDNSVDFNPHSLYTDPEFQKLNPGIAQNATDPDGFQIPTVVAGNSDMTWTTTSWIAANKDAASFLAGQYDPWGTHINTSYLGVKYPTDSLVTQDSYFPVAQQYSPTYPLSRVAQYQAQNWKPGTSDQKDPQGNYPTLPLEAPGLRSLYAIVDEADAADFLFPTAAILNHAGRYVEPTMSSMAAAVRDMTVNPDGITRSVNETSNDPKAYPLTMVIYAVVPTGGIPAAKAQKIAAFLDYVAGAGQVSGSSPGQLAPGYLPLPAALRAQTLKAASEVLNQTGNPKSHSGGGGGGGTGSHTPSPSSTPSSSPSSTASHSRSPGASSPASAARGVTVAFSRPASTGTAWIVLALLIAGITFVVAGPAALVLGSPGGRAAVLTGARRARNIGSWRPRSPLRPHSKWRR